MFVKKIIRIVMLDDHDLILYGIESAVKQEADIEILESFNSSRQLLDALPRFEADVDVIIIDYSLRPGELDGLHLIRALRVRYPRIYVLVISALHSPSTVALAIRTGARGFVGKAQSWEVLTAAIRQVAAGKIFIDPKTSSQIDSIVNISPLERAVENDLSLNAKVFSLTAREYEVLRCCLDGMSVTQISEKFLRSIKTISTQKRTAFRKMGLTCDNELYKIRYLVEGR